MAKLTHDEKIRKEITKREKQLNTPKSRMYLPWLLLVMSIIYITDEVASQIGTLMKTEIANDMLAKYGQSSVGILDLLTMVSVPFMALSVLYKPLADKYGRKPFLIINTFGMCFGLLVVYLSQNIAMYVAGVCITQFFTPHDMQAVYILESTPEKHRAKIYFTIKSIAQLGVMFVPLLRKTFMHTTSEWRNVYLLPAVIGIGISLISIFLTKETDAFNKARVNYLKGNTQENGTEASGGVIKALKFVWKHKQLRWLYAALACAEIGFVLQINYQVIMSYGYAEHLMASQGISDINAALETVGVNQITTALFMFPVGCAIGQFFSGYISDFLNRKATAAIMSVASVILLVSFSIGSKQGMNPYLVGFLAGACVGTFWSNIDTIMMMVGESAPTSLRSSILAAVYIATGLGIGISYGVSIPLTTIFGNEHVSTIALCLAVPGLIAAFLILLFKTKDTKGIDMSTVKGDEFE